MFLPIIFFLAGAAYAQQPSAQLALVNGKESLADESFGGISGLGISLLEGNKAEFWAVSDDARRDESAGPDGRPDVNKNPRFFDGTMLFGSSGNDFMTMKPEVVIPIPRIPADGEADIRPEGFHFCGEFLYVGNGNANIRRFPPRSPDSAVPVPDAVFYATPDNYEAGDNIEGVAVEKQDDKKPLVYSVSAGAVSKYANMDNNPASILEWDGNTGELLREFLMPQAEGERTMDLVWEGGRRFVYLVAVEGSQGQNPAGSNPGVAASPQRMRLYSCVLPDAGLQDQNVLNMGIDEIKARGDSMLMGRNMLAEFSIEDEGEMGEKLSLSQPGSAQASSVSFPSRSGMPNFDGIAFGPNMQDGEEVVRLLFLISDNNFAPSVNTRYVSLSYKPSSKQPQPQVPGAF